MEILRLASFLILILGIKGRYFFRLPLSPSQRNYHILCTRFVVAIPIADISEDIQHITDLSTLLFLLLLYILLSSD